MSILRLLTVGMWYFIKRNRWNFLVILALIGISGLGLYQSALDNLGADKAWWSGMWQNFATEVIGAILTFAIFEMLINANNRQEELIRQMGSGDNATALNALNELRALGYLFDGTLHGKSFISANLAGANLAGADLSGANLSGANLTGSNLQGARIEDTQLANALIDEQTILPNGVYGSADIGLAKQVSNQSISHPYRVLRAKRRRNNGRR